MQKPFSGCVLSAFLIVVPFAGKILADSTTVNFNSGAELLYSDMGLSEPLSPGAAMVSGDGDVLQLGYYSMATASNEFLGTFIPLSGPTSSDTYTTTSIGDAPANTAGAAGTYALSLSFSPGTATGNNLPVAGVPLAIAFYNGTTLGTSTSYNVVSDASWVWIESAPTASQVNITLDDAGLQWFGGTSSAFYTAVPEPSALVWFGVGATACFAIWQRRSRSV